MTRIAHRERLGSKVVERMERVSRERYQAWCKAGGKEASHERCLVHHWHHERAHL